MVEDEERDGGQKKKDKGKGVRERGSCLQNLRLCGSVLETEG